MEVLRLEVLEIKKLMRSGLNKIPHQRVFKVDLKVFCGATSAQKLKSSIDGLLLLATLRMANLSVKKLNPVFL